MDLFLVILVTVSSPISETFIGCAAPCMTKGVAFMSSHYDNRTAVLKSTTDGEPTVHQFLDISPIRNREPGTTQNRHLCVELQN